MKKKDKLEVLQWTVIAAFMVVIGCVEVKRQLETVASGKALGTVTELRAANDSLKVELLQLENENEMLRVNATAEKRWERWWRWGEELLDVQ